MAKTIQFELEDDLNKEVETFQFENELTKKTDAIKEMLREYVKIKRKQK
jgi:hypothetical protein